MPKKNHLKHPGLPPWQIRLSLNAQNQMIATPAAGNAAGQPPLEPFILPPIALGNVVWLSSLTEAMYARHNRCMALWLVLNCRNPRWQRPIIPHQRCGTDGAAWRVEEGDLAELPPDCRVGGSFQMRLASGMEEASGSIPPIDGLHFVMGIEPNARTLYLFLRMDQRIECISHEQIVLNDWHRTLDDHHQRLEMI